MAFTLQTLLDGTPAPSDRPPLTGRVVRVEGGVYVAGIDDDSRHPVGPCRGPAGLSVGDVVLLIWTDNERAWVAAVDRT